MKTTEKQKGERWAVSYVRQPRWCLLCHLMICSLKYRISSRAFNHLELSTKVVHRENTSPAVEWLGTLLEVTCWIQSWELKSQTYGLRNLFSKFSYVTEMYKIYPQVIRMPEPFKLFAYWCRLNHLELY